DHAGKFLWNLHAFYLAYASNRVPEITNTIVNIDNAMKWGFSHEMGPFEIWDAIGVAESIPTFEAAGYPVADWVKEMVASGHNSFYTYGADGSKTAYYSLPDKDYVTIPSDPRVITTKQLHAQKSVVATNGSASVLDLGDGVALLEFHSQASAIDADLV